MTDIKIIFLGDSITFGYGISSRNRWTRLVADKLNIEEINRGVNGDTTGGMLVRLQEILKDDVSDSVIMITGGANDILFANDANIAKANIAAMTNQIQAKGAVPLVGIMMPIVPKMCYLSWDPFVNYEKANATILEYREWLKGYSRCFGLECFDFADAVTEENSESLLLDGLHPNERGHTLIADKLIGKITAVNKNLQ